MVIVVIADTSVSTSSFSHAKLNAVLSIDSASLVLWPVWRVNGPGWWVMMKKLVLKTLSAWKTSLFEICSCESNLLLPEIPLLRDMETSADIHTCRLLSFTFMSPDFPAVSPTVLSHTQTSTLYCVRTDLCTYTHKDTLIHTHYLTTATVSLCLC